MQQKLQIFYNHSCFAREGRLISKVKIQSHFVIIFCAIWFAQSRYYRQDLKETSYVINWLSSSFSASSSNEYSLLWYWPLKLTPCVFVWLPERRNLQIFLPTFSKRLKKGRHFRGQKFLRFRSFWPIPWNFMSTKFLKIGHKRNLMCIQFFKIGYMRKFISAKFKYWPPTKDFDHKFLLKGMCQSARSFQIFKPQSYFQIT